MKNVRLAITIEEPAPHLSERSSKAVALRVLPVSFASDVYVIFHHLLVNKRHQVLFCHIRNE